MLRAHPDAKHDFAHPAWGGYTGPHHWNEPLFGYYHTEDRWVLRRHAELLAAADVDVIIFDNTNGAATWKSSYDVLLEVFDEARRDGVNPPQISFLLPFWGGKNNLTQLRLLYADLYQANRYPDLWFRWKGKPLIMASPEELLASDEPEDRRIADFFTFRPGIPEYNVSDADRQAEDRERGLPYRKQYWSWLSVYPQVINRNEDGSPEQMAVSVAQNWCAERGLTPMNGENVFGRTYTSNGYDARPDALLRGANFNEQAALALKTDPEFVFITGFNEWIAGRYSEMWGVPNALPDECCDAFSRDVEPTKGILRDHYYYQTVGFIRRFKGAPADPPDGAYATIRSLRDWDGAGKTYTAYAGNVFDRDSSGYAGARYTDLSGRNDIADAAAASDRENVYFLAACKDCITPPTEENWMRLLISVPGAEKTWEGYSHIVNRVSPDRNKAVLEKSLGGWRWKKQAQVDITVEGRYVWIKIPKACLGVAGDAFTLDFKWTDNTLADGDIMDLYVHGDTAPIGRFNYRYSFALRRDETAV